MNYPAFVGASYESQSRIADVERLVNRYVEKMEVQGTTSRSALYPVPGVTSLFTSTDAPGRAHWCESGREFAVQGTSLIEFDVNGFGTYRATVALDERPAQIVSNGDGGDQLLVISGKHAYVYDLTANTLTEIASLSGKATQCGYLHGYGIVLDSATSTFYISALLDFTTFTTGTDFAQRSTVSDAWVAMAVNGIYLMLYGEKTSEAWYDAGTASFPFAPHPSGLTLYGCAASFSCAVGEGHAFRLGQSSIGQRYVLHASGFADEVVSDLPRQATFDSYRVVSDAQGEIINWRGHVFYLLTFPAADITWAYDLTGNYWFEWRSWISENHAFTVWRPRWHAMAFGQHRILDSQTGSLYKLDATVFLDVDSRPLRWLRVAPELSAANELIQFARFALGIETGVGTEATGQGEDPTVMMRYSDDSGQNWSAEQQRRLGKVGEYSTIVEWWRLGAARHRVFEVSGSDPVPMRIVDAFLDFGQPVRALQGAK
jgi:hypothetical protein